MRRTRVFCQNDLTIIRQTSYRSAHFHIETSDDNPPQFEFDYVPGGDGSKDSIDMYNCETNNIKSVELDSMLDGWYQNIVFPDDMSGEEQARLEALIEESGDVYDVLERQEGWQQTETQVWIWGPILIEDEQGNQVRIIGADEDGDVVEYEDE